MSLFYRQFYLIIHICIGILIIGIEYLYRWIIETYQIHIRICPNVFYIEFKQLNNIQSYNWFENKFNKLIETFYSINNQCSIKELKFNIIFIFIFLRYLWLSISSIFIYFTLKYTMKLKNI